MPFPPLPAPRPRSFWRELPALLILALVLAFLVKSFVLQPFYIPSGSMEQTLQVGDRVLVNKVVYRVRDVGRGDVVVFNGVDSFTPEASVTRPTDPVGRVTDWLGQVVGIAPADERDFVKRVIGVGGDTVRCCDAEGQITVNGVALDETSYLYPGDRPSEEPFDVVVPEGKLWVMGDHRSASSDSRAHQGEPGGGFVPQDRVIGRAFVVAWPWSRAQVLEVPATFDQPGLAP
jgi:signal peptidase I